MTPDSITVTLDLVNNRQLTGSLVALPSHLADRVPAGRFLTLKRGDKIDLISIYQIFAITLD